MNLQLFFKPLTPRQRALKRYTKTYWGIVPSDVRWYEKALRHKSVIGAGKFCHNDCNERLELLGDAVLDTVVTEYLFKRFPDANEGELTKIRSRVVNRQTLGQVGMSAQLDGMIEARIGSDDSKDKIVGNALEAWLGAIYVDKGFESTRRSILDYLIPQYIDIEQAVHQSSDFKSQFIEWAQREKIEFEFKTFAANMDDGFTCEIHVNGSISATFTERSKKRAEKEAARLACEQLGIQTHV